jgi:hypothetical protein
MAGTSRSLQKYFRSVDEANATLTRRWRAITHHLKLGLGTPIPGAAILLRTYEAPKDYAGDDGKKHRNPRELCMASETRRSSASKATWSSTTGTRPT